MASTELESAIWTLVNNFYAYAKSHRREEKMGRKEFRNMVSQELHHVLTNAENKDCLNKMITDLDDDGDKKISFQEYWKLIAAVARGMSTQTASQ
ncbi:protein S100-A16-like [Mantella aurantiaca]